jgi:uncharacterized protein (TIGR02466 family)|tara:strand:- start:555 stop:1166 length:612 start_codon:yes stop_codon:yes gene_type:complete
MIEPIIHGIFPTPIYISGLGRKLTSKENKFIQKTKRDVYKNDGNTTSNDTYIFNNKIFNTLKKELEVIVQDYFKQILSAKNVTPYITQSWLNYTEKNQFHHKHRHPNSMVSGVFYIDADEKYDRIYFYNDKHSVIVPEVNEFNTFNSGSWFFPVKTGQLFLFPSSLEHMVETKKGSNTRISLAFNVFVKGSLGETKTLTKLKL